MQMPCEKSLKIKQSPTTVEAKEAVAVLRAQLEVELKSKKQCMYQPYECTQFSLDGYNYCLRHILEDKTAPFKQCTYVHPNNGKRCYFPASKTEKKDFMYCNEHALKAHLLRSRQNARFPPPHTAEYLLQSLSHYVKKPRSRTVSSSTQYSEDNSNNAIDEPEPKITKGFDPFVDIDAQKVNLNGSTVLDMCSESESDVEPSTYTSVWHDPQADSSDNESIDSEQEDVLKHANVYTAEEITLVTKDKLIRLQSLYIDQYRHLQHILRERRRRYLMSLKREKETFCSITNQVRDTPKEQRLYKKLKAYTHYHRKNGIEAVLNKRVNELRLKITEGMVPKLINHTKCAYTEGGVKCGERSLPVARHCRKHILQDPHQVLFRACGKVCDDTQCTTPVEMIFNDATCRLHMNIPPVRSYAQMRKDSESDYGDAEEMHGLNMSVKTEFMPHDFTSNISGIQSVSNDTILSDSKFESTDTANESQLTDDESINLDINKVIKSEKEEPPIDKMDVDDPKLISDDLVQIKKEALDESEILEDQPKMDIEGQEEFKHEMERVA